MQQVADTEETETLALAALVVEAQVTDLEQVEQELRDKALK